MSSTKDWKKHLLASGLPLEHSVAAILRSKGYLNQLEYGYVKYNEDGVTSESSIDIRAVQRNDLKRFVTVLMVECKYRSPDTMWVFLPDTTIPPFNRRENIIHDNNMYAESYLVVPHEAQSISGDDYVLRGIELKLDGKNPASITKGISQLRYASLENSIQQTLTNIRLSTDLYIGTRFPSACVQILVTTAPLRTLKQETDISQIADASSIEEVTNEHPYVILKLPPDALFTFNARRRYEDTLSVKALNSIDISRQVSNARATSAIINTEDFINHITTFHPRVFVIVNQVHFSDFLNKLDEELERLSVLSPERARELHRVR